LSVGLGVAHLQNVQLDLLASEFLELSADPLCLGATSPNDDTGTRSVQEDGHPFAAALDLDRTDAGSLERLAQILPDSLILCNERRVLLLGVPARLVVGGHAQAEANRVDLLPHPQASFCSSVFFPAPAFSAVAGFLLALALGAGATFCSRGSTTTVI